MEKGQEVIMYDRDDSDWNEKKKDQNPFKTKSHYVMLVLLIIGIVAIIGVGIYIGIDKVKSEATTTSPPTTATGQPSTATPTEIVVRYTAVNNLTEAGDLFTASQDVTIHSGSNAFAVMQQGAASNSLLMFNYTVFDGLGASINEINGVKADNSKELFWSFMKRNASELCLHNVGVSSYIPTDGEELYFSMAKYSIFDHVPNCVTENPQPHDVTTAASNDEIVVRYTAENNLTEAGDLFSASEDVTIPSGSNAFAVMQKGAASNSMLMFNYTLFEVLGASIQEINGVKVDYSRELFWSFMKRNSSELCLHNVGVSSYIPTDGEELYFSMAKYSIFDHVPNCVTGKPQPHDVVTTASITAEIVVRYTAENNLTEAGDLFSASQDVTIHSGSNAFAVMQEGAASNSLLMFNYTLFDGLGAYINEINGVEADHSEELFWSFMKRNASELCLHNVGVSSYIPIDGEELYFRMAKYSIFDQIPNCVTGNPQPHDVTTTASNVVTA